MCFYWVIDWNTVLNQSVPDVFSYGCFLTVNNSYHVSYQLNRIKSKPSLPETWIWHTAAPELMNSPKFQQQWSHKVCCACHPWNEWQWRLLLANLSGRCNSRDIAMPTLYILKPRQEYSIRSVHNHHSKCFYSSELSSHITLNNSRITTFIINSSTYKISVSIIFIMYGRRSLLKHC